MVLLSILWNFDNDRLSDSPDMIKKTLSCVEPTWFPLYLFFIQNLIADSTKPTVKPKKSRKNEKDLITPESRTNIEGSNTSKVITTSKKCKVLLTKVDHLKISENDAILMLKSFDLKQQVNVTSSDSESSASNKMTLSAKSLIKKEKNYQFSPNKSSKKVTTNKENPPKISEKESKKKESDLKTTEGVIESVTPTLKGKANSESDSDDTISIDEDFDISNITENEQNDLSYTVTESNGVKVYECKECPVTSATLCFFRNHMQQIHGKEMPLYTCKYCGESFSYRKRRKLHILNNHHDEKQRLAVLYFTSCVDCLMVY